MIYETLLMLEFPVMGIILGLFAGMYFLYIYFKVDKSVTALLHGILFFTFIGILIYSVFIYIALALLILTIAYEVLYDPGFYKRLHKKNPRLELLFRIILVLWLLIIVLNII